MMGVLQQRKGKSNISSKLPKVTQLVNMKTVWTQAFQLLFEWFFITGLITGYLLWQTILTSKWLKQYMFLFYDTIQHFGCQLEGWELCTPLSLPSTPLDPLSSVQDVKDEKEQQGSCGKVWNFILGNGLLTSCSYSIVQNFARPLALLQLGQEMKFY